MKSKKEIPEIIIDNVKIDVTTKLFDNILGIFPEINCNNQKEIAKKVNYNEKSFSYLLKHRQVVNKPMKIFVYQSYQHIVKNHSDLFYFNKATCCFEKINTKAPPQFIDDGIYYGFFRKSDLPLEASYHFILKVNGKTITVWSKYNSHEYIASTGTLEENDGTYFCVLRDEHKKANFFIGKKTTDQLRKIFIGTWSTADGSICSALCVVYYIQGSLYNTLEKIKAAKKELHKEILSKCPDDAEEFFKTQPHKFITEKNW